MPLEIGLISYFDFDGNTEDQVGDNDLTLLGGAQIGTGRTGSGLILDGIQGTGATQISNNGAFDFGTGDFTISAWVRLDALGREQTIIEDFSGGGGPGWTLTMPYAGSLQFYATGALTISASGLAVTPGSWHQYAVSRQGSTFNLFFDGQVVATSTSSTPIVTSTNPLLIGGRNLGDGRNFTVDGTIDDVAIWSRALAGPELLEPPVPETTAFVINAVATGYQPNSSTSYHYQYPIDYSNSGAFPNMWRSGIAGGTFTMDGITTFYSDGHGNDTYTMSVDELAFYAPIVTPGVGVTGYQLIGTGSMPTFSHTGAGGAAGASIYTEFGQHMASIDLEFNGSGVVDYIDGNGLSGVGKTATFYGNGGDDTLYGSALANNIMFGGVGNDTLTIFAGHGTHPGAEHVLDGGDGNDTIGLDDRVGDRATLIGGSGDDQIGASAGGVHIFSGGAGNDSLNGNGTDKAVYGGKSNEYIIDAHHVTDARVGGPDGADTIFGIKYLQFSNGTFTLTSLTKVGVTIHGTSGNDVISDTSAPSGQPLATRFVDTIYGGAGDDNLDGFAGNDRMFGGSGNDVYRADYAGDQAIETNQSTGLDEGGHDLVNAQVSYTLGAFVEELRLLGSAIGGTGNGMANLIVGSGLDNVLDGQGGNDRVLAKTGNDTLFGGTGLDRLQGGAGNDWLYGGLDNDTLIGSTGIDRFVFDTALDRAFNVDRLVDFNSGEDEIWLDASIFTGIAHDADGALTGGFTLGRVSAADHRIIYNDVTGAIFYDSDGVGGASSIRFATVAVGTELNIGDFHLLA